MPSRARKRGEPLTGFTDANPGMAFSPDGRRVAASDLSDGIVRVYDLDARRQIASLTKSRGPSFPWFLDDRRLLVRAESELAVWRFADVTPALGTTLPRPAGGVSMFGFTGRGAEVVTTGFDDHRLLRWRTRRAARGRLLDGRAARFRHWGSVPTVARC